MEDKQEQCCANCEFGRYEEETDCLMCINELQIHTYIEKDDYCIYHEYPF